MLTPSDRAPARGNGGAVFKLYFALLVQTLLALLALLVQLFGNGGADFKLYFALPVQKHI
jgi:hypothetical protein